MPFCFRSHFFPGAFVPTKTLPSWLQDFVNVNPLTYIVSAARQTAESGDDRERFLAVYFRLGCYRRDIRSADVAFLLAQSIAVPMEMIETRQGFGLIRQLCHRSAIEAKSQNESGLSSHSSKLA